MSVAMRPAVVVTKGLTSPPLLDQITLNGHTVDMTGATVTFYMRPLLSRTPVINGATGAPMAPPDEDDNNVRYNWSSGDVAIEGDFMGWWRFVLPSASPEETPEFSVVISDHGPGLGTPTGVVVDGIAAHMPTTFRALRGDVQFGDRFLQQKADVVKLRVLGVAAAPDDEAALHPLLIDYLSKRTALDLITPGIDYWQRQYRTQVTTGTSEVSSYPDAIAALEKLREQFIEELAQDWRDLQLFDLDLPFRRVSVMPASSLKPPPQTPDPYVGLPLETGHVGIGLTFGPFSFP